MIIYCKLVISVISIIFLMSSCSIIQRTVYSPNINQGNYITNDDIAKLKKGITKKEVVYILGTPMLKTVCDQSVWYYIFRQEQSYAKVKQQTLKLNFDQNDILVKIKTTDKLTTK